jgi:hypothetical protein
MNILKNKFFFAIVIIFIFCFSIVLYLGMNKIYEKEAELRHSIANTQLLSATSTIDYFFSDTQSKLLFLESDVRIQEFLDTKFDSIKLKKEITLFLKGLVSHSVNILQAYLPDIPKGWPGTLFLLKQESLRLQMSMMPCGLIDLIRIVSIM